MFKKVLVANRGEIAVRVIRACRDLGIATVAVFSEADRGALHVRMADEAFSVGPAPSLESYLRVDRMIEVVGRTGADAVHPGYGFLAENAEFARACADEGVRFVGPSPEAIALMGSKVESRRLVSAKGIPLVPGTTDPVVSEDEARRTGERIGYPVILKASAGGGGKGMRPVYGSADMSGAFRAAGAESRAAFGDETVYIEKLIEGPRHVEIQVLADQHGRAVHLGERECTIQRRHQKVIEESPSPIMDEELRGEMGQAALAVVEAARYTNAGTVEFLVDRERRFYFLEMNTRLQVEHPVTEAVTGIDLVAEQLKVAAGEPLSMTQADIRLDGAAIECRIYAEDPRNDFLPSPGRISRLRTPSGPGIRVDGGVYEGWTVPFEYDPLLSKLVAWAPSRAQAIRRMQRALGEYRIDGIETTIGFFRAALDSPDFISGDFDTGFIDRWLSDEAPFQSRLSETERDLALLVAAVHESRRAGRVDSPGPASSPWKLAARRKQMESR